MFSRVIIPNPHPVLKTHRKLLESCSAEPVLFFDSPCSGEDELIERCSDAEAVVIGWDSRLSSRVIEACPKLKYIGLACTLFEGEGSNVDLKTARSRGIEVTGIRDYGDIGVAEWVVSEIVYHLQYREPRRELAGRKVGVVGAGGAGGPVALALQAMGADVSYFSRSAKALMDEAGIPRMGLAELFGWADFLTLHLPRNTIIGGEELLARFGGELLINTSLGLPLEPEAVRRWLDREGHYAAFDSVGLGALTDQKDDPAVRYLPASSGFTSEAEGRLAEKVVENMKTFLHS